MRKLVHAFRNGEAFLDHYWSEGAREELFLPGMIACTAGELLDLEVGIEQTGYRLRTLAQVLLCRLQDGEDRPVGSLVRLVGSPNRQLLVRNARGPAPTGAPVRDREPCRFPITIVHRSEEEHAEARDYSIGGVEVVGGPAGLDVGDAVQLRIGFAGLTLGLPGQVVWVQRVPELACGVSVRPFGSLMRRRMQRLYERLLAWRCRSAGGLQ